MNDYEMKVGGADGLSDYMLGEADRLRTLGRFRWAEAIVATDRSLRRFARGSALDFDDLTPDLMRRYEAYLRGEGLARNTSSFYMRVARSVYNRAVTEGLVADCRPFASVYTGIDRTSKRSLTLDEMRCLRRLDLVRQPRLEFARDVFFFSFYMRGMSFVDMAFLRKSDVRDGFVRYRRRKTSRLLTAEYVPQMQAVVERWPSATQYLLPIIEREDGSEREQYKARLVSINRCLKLVGRLAGLRLPLTTYVSRHSWATIAREAQVPLAVISEALGHDSLLTTQIYLDSIGSAAVDRANRLVIEGL